MKKLAGLVLVVAGLAAPGVAEARGFRNGAVNTPFGSFNTNSPEYRMSGGDPFAAMEIKQQMMMMKQQQQYMKQMQKMQQQFQQKMKSDPNFRKQVEAQQAQMRAAYAAQQQPRKKKKRPTFNGSTASKDTIKTRNDDSTKPTDGEKPATAGAASELKSRRDDDAKAETKPAK